MKIRSLFIAFVIILSVFGIFLRIYQISLIPASISYDELDNVVNGLGIFYTGKDFQGQHFFWELYPTITHTFTAELSALWHAGPQILLSQLAFARLPNVIAGFAMTVALAFFSFQIFRSRQIAAFVFLLIMLSPWHILLSRTAYEAPIALSLLTISIVLFWQTLESKRFKIQIIFLCLTILFTLASFFTYHGYKPLFPLIYILLFFWHERIPLKRVLSKHGVLNKRVIPLLSVLFIWVLAFSFFSIRLEQGVYGDRTNEISFFNTDAISAEVNLKRQMSLDNRFTAVSTNKVSVIGEKIIHNAFDAFNPVMLFLTGYDNSYAIGFWNHGFLYLLQLPLIILGLIWTSKYKQRDSVFLLLLLFIALIPSVIHEGSSMALRSNLFIPILIIFSAAGIYYLLHKKYVFKTVVLSIVGIVFLFSILSFQMFYFNQFPIYTIDTSIFKERLLASYVSKNNQANKPILVLADEPFNSMRMIAYYNGLIDGSTIRDWQSILHDSKQNTYKYANITVTRDCGNVKAYKTDNIIISSNKNAEVCDFDAQYATNSAVLKLEENNRKVVILTSPRDNGDYFRVYNDQICQNQPLQDFIHINSADDFAVEKLTPSELCNQWIRAETIKN